MTTAPPQSSLQEAFALLDRVQDRTIFVGPVTDAQMAVGESSLGQTLPDALRQFIARYGAIKTRSEYKLFGLGVPNIASPSLVWAFRWLKFTSPDCPSTLLPIAPTGEHQFVCLLSESNSPPDSARVVAWELGRSAAEQMLTEIAPNYAAYLRQIAWELNALDRALVTLRAHIKNFSERFGYDRGHQVGRVHQRHEAADKPPSNQPVKAAGKLPRNHDWRPYRFCSQDIVLGAHVQRHIKGENYLEVGVFLPIDVYPFEQGSSLLGLTMSILSDAYRCGGTMEIRFTPKVDGGQVPRKLRALAEAVGAPIKPESLARRRLDPDDARRLFVALTDFSPLARQRLTQLDIRPERACYAVQRGVWPKAEAEILLLADDEANRIFAGGAPPEQRALFQFDRLHACAAILAGYLDRGLALRERELSGQETLELEDDIRAVETGYEAQLAARIYRVLPAAGEASADFQIPWLAAGSTWSGRIAFGQKFMALIRARSQAELVRDFEVDLEAAHTLQHERQLPVLLLVPYDFYHAALETQRAQWIEKANQAGLGIVVCAELVDGLDDEAYRRFSAGRIMRE